jgi:folate-dependent phosphoribosylglycinamide formyltransferase PurN
VDEHYDTGKTLAQRVVPVFADDTPELLAARVLHEVRVQPSRLRQFQFHRRTIEVNLQPKVFIVFLIEICHPGASSLC